MFLEVNLLPAWNHSDQIDFSIKSKWFFMRVKKLGKIESLLLDLIIYCTEEVNCDPEVIDEPKSIKHKIYQLEKRIPRRKMIA